MQGYFDSNGGHRGITLVFFAAVIHKPTCNCYASCMRYTILSPFVFTFLIWISGCGMNQGSRVRLEHAGDRYTLIKDGIQHPIYGVGGSGHVELLAEYGGNTIRTWDAEDIDELLDEAQANGVSVVAGIWLEHQRHGFDYNDPEQREEQLKRVERLVKQHRDHPALLAWGIGNELELGGDMDIAIRQINDAAAIVKRLDPHHPRMAVIAEIGDDKAARIQRECPDIDMLGINAYGGLGSLPQRLKEQGYNGPWAVTEYGVVGHWETGKTPWGAPYEQSSSSKADFLRDCYTRSIAPNMDGQCLGSFAFLWGNKQEKTETWYGLLLPTGETTERVDVLEEMWTGERPGNRAPRVEGIEVLEGDVNRLDPRERVRVRVKAEEPDGDPMGVEWRMIPESTAQSMGGDFEQGIGAADVDIEPDGELGAWITMPRVNGPYRIFVTVRDGKGHAGTANLPVFVGDPSSVSE